MLRCAQVEAFGSESHQRVQLWSTCYALLLSLEVNHTFDQHPADPPASPFSWPRCPQPDPHQRVDLRAAEAADRGQPDARPAAAPGRLPREADAGEEGVSQISSLRFVGKGACSHTMARLEKLMLVRVGGDSNLAFLLVWRQGFPTRGGLQRPQGLQRRPARNKPQQLALLADCPAAFRLPFPCCRTCSATWSPRTATSSRRTSPLCGTSSRARSERCGRRIETL